MADMRPLIYAGLALHVVACLLSWLRYSFGSKCIDVVGRRDIQADYIRSTNIRFSV